MLFSYLYYKNFNLLENVYLNEMVRNVLGLSSLFSLNFSWFSP